MNPSDVGQFSAIFYTQQRAQAELMSLSAPLDPKSKIKTTSHFFGYRNKEDYTNLPPGFLIPPSRNVFINTNGLVQTRLGYVLDGQTDTTSASVLGSHDWYRGLNGEGHVRVANNKIQFRYVANAGDTWNGNTFIENQVYWIDLLTTLPSNYVEFTTFWDSNESMYKILFVGQQSEINEWSGAVATLASASNAAGVISALTLQSGGNGYAVGDVVTVSTGNANAKFTVTRLAYLAAKTVAISSAGSGYSLNDVLTLGNTSGGGTVGSGCTVKVTSVGGGGAITGISIITQGSNYGNGLAYAVSGGTGSGAYIQVASTTNSAVQGFTLIDSGDGYSTGSGVATTGGSGTGATMNITTVVTGKITVNGNLTVGELGFYIATTSNQNLNINGNIYSYSSVIGNNFVGITGNATGEPTQSVIFQNPIVTKNSAMTQIPASFRNDTIRTLNNQVYVGSYLSNVVYKSKINTYNDYSQGSPRLPGDGYTWTLDGLLRALAPQESTMYASWGHGGWTTLVFNDNLDTSTGTAAETATITTLKTGVLQAALSQALAVSIGNDLAFVTNEPTLTTMGRIANNFGIPQMMNISDPIKNDFDDYGTGSFANGHAVYWNYYLWVSVPQKGIVLRYNIAKSWWEPPQYIPIGRFSIIDGQLYGHSASSPETYQLETGTNDNGQPMDAIAALSYDQMGLRYGLKNFNNFGVEGYIAANTTLYLMTKLDFGGFSGSPTYIINGNDFAILFQTIADGSLGKNPIGEQPIGSITDSPSNLAKFRVIKTGIPINFFEYQPYFESNDVDQQWQILSFGPEITPGPEPSQIKE